jgi:uroporphyrinogen-III synthase
MADLKGKIIITTCAEDKALKINEMLKPKGVEMHNFPLIDVQEAFNNVKEIELAFKVLDSFNWIVFTSTNGVKFFQHWLKKLDRTVNYAKVKTAAIGSSTAEAMLKAGWVPTYVSKGKDSTEFAKELLAVIPGTKKILLPTGNLAPDTLQNTLSKKHSCHKVVVYNTYKSEIKNQDLQKRVNSKKYDLILFLSPSAVNSFMSVIDKTTGMEKLKCAAIGSTTKLALTNYGVNPIVVPEVPDIEHLIIDIEQYFKGRD